MAEKLEAMVALGMANSRMKDYYDLFLISNTFTLNHRSLKDAVWQTFEKRGTLFPDGTPVGLTQDFATAWQARWRGFVGRERMIPVPNEFTAVIAKLKDFVASILHGSEQDLLWQPGGPWRTKSGTPS